MNLEKVIEATDAAVFVKTGRHISEVEIILLSGAWQGMTYEQMAETCKYSLAYLKQAAGPRLWKLLSEVFGEDISKTSFRALVERQWLFSSRDTSQSQLGEMPDSQKFAQSFSVPDVEDTTSETPKHEGVSASISQHQDWGEAPDVSTFYGRTEELTKLQQWIVKDRCRLVAIVGMGGIGKTTLSVRCAKQVQDEFEAVVWRSLRNAPPIEELLGELLQSLSRQQTIYLSANLGDRITRLIDYLYKHRCLLVLDSIEGILRRGELAGYYREEHKGYRDFLRRVGETPHQSCLVLTSLEKPREIAALEGKTLPVRSLQLAGLQSEAREIFKEKNLLEEHKWGDLIQLYRGNPLALKIVATTIQELFGGNVSEFLQQNTIVFGDIGDILDEQFERLSSLEQEILYWLAIECQPVSLAGLREDILSPIAQTEIIEALESLRRRSLIEKNVAAGKVLFTLQQPVITEYINSQLIKYVSEEIREVCKTQKIEKIELLRNHALVKAPKQDEAIRKLQVRLLLTPVKDKLCTVFRDERLIEAQLTNILSMLQGKSSLAVGYATENIQNLLIELKSDLTSRNFSYNP